VPRLDDGVFKLLRDGKSDQALRELEAGPALSIFGFRDHGALLQIAGLKRKAIQYDIGNPLTASKMTRHSCQQVFMRRSAYFCAKVPKVVPLSNMTGQKASSDNTMTATSTQSR
jgi:hypothetical protein